MKAVSVSFKATEADGREEATVSRAAASEITTDVAAVVAFFFVLFCFFYIKR